MRGSSEPKGQRHHSDELSWKPSSRTCVYVSESLRVAFNMGRCFHQVENSELTILFLCWPFKSLLLHCLLAYIVLRKMSAVILISVSW